MQFNLLTLLGISLATLFFGYFFGLFEGRGQGYKRRKQEEEREKKARAALQAPLPPPASTERTLLKLSLDRQQQFCLDLDEQRLNPAQLTPAQRKRLIDLMVTMRPWVEASPPSTPAASRPPSTGASAIRFPVPPPSRPASAPLPLNPIPASGSALPVEGAGAQEAPAPTSMVGQIDAILQARLAGTPLAGRGVRLVESPQGGVIVMVGVNRYPSLGDVPDPAVQAVIRAAIAEWEQRFTPGGKP